MPDFSMCVFIAHYFDVYFAVPLHRLADSSNIYHPFSYHSYYTNCFSILFGCQPDYEHKIDGRKEEEIYSNIIH